MGSKLFWWICGTILFLVFFPIFLLWLSAYCPPLEKFFDGILFSQSLETPKVTPPKVHKPRIMATKIPNEKYDEVAKEAFTFFAGEPASVFKGDQIRFSDVAAILYYEGGAPWELCETYIFNNESKKGYCFLENDISELEPSRETRAAYVGTIGDAAVKVLQNKFDAAHMEKWESNYDAGLCDGTFWSLHIVFKDGSHKRFSGANCWPESGNEFFRVFARCCKKQ